MRPAGLMRVQLQAAARTQEYSGACFRLASSLTGRWSEGTAISCRSSAGSMPPPALSRRAARRDLTHTVRGQAARQLLQGWWPGRAPCRRGCLPAPQLQAARGRGLLSQGWAAWAWAWPSGQHGAAERACRPAGRIAVPV